METEVAVAPVAPVQAVAPVQTVAPTYTVAPSNGGDDVFESMGSQKPMDLKSLLVFGLLIAFSIYGITYYRKAIAKLNEEKKPNDDFLNLVDDVEEVYHFVTSNLGHDDHTDSYNMQQPIPAGFKNHLKQMMPEHIEKTKAGYL